MFAVHLQVRLNHPMLAVQAQALEQKSVRPRAPVRTFVQVALGAADRLVNQRDTPGKPDAPGPGVEFEKLPVRQTGHYHHLRLNCGRLHGNSAAWEGRTQDRAGKVFLYFSSFSFKNGPKRATITIRTSHMGP